MRERLLIKSEDVDREPYASIICYPKAVPLEIKRRLMELRRLGIEHIEFSGDKRVLGIPVLGKGCVGVVVAAYMDSDKIALKIRRVDADRAGMTDEAAKLRRANSVGVGPRLLGVSRNFLMMKFIEGDLLPSWLEKCREKSSLKSVLRRILEQCWLLDELRLDHGELSQASKHLIIDAAGNPFIVDFESASLNRRVANTTSICQFLFLSGSVAEMVNSKHEGVNRKTIIETLRLYKKHRTRKSFEQVLEACGL